MSRSDDDHIELRTVLGAMHEGVVVWAADGTIRSCNAAAERILGLSFEQLVSGAQLDPPWHMTYEDGTPFPVTDLPAITTLRTGEPQRGVIIGVHRGGESESWISVDTAPLIRAGEDAPYAVVVTFTDVTEQRSTMAALRRSEAHLRLALAGARMGTWEWAVGGAIEWSDEVFQIFGVARGGFDGSFQRYVSLVHPDDRARLEDAIQSAVHDAASPFEVRHRVITPRGELRWVHCQGSVFCDATGAPARMLGTVSDVTQQVRIEAELARALRMESIGRLAGGIAHDFNNLLTAILGSAELATQKLGARERTASELLEIVIGASQQASRLTRQLLAFARSQPLELTLVAIDPLVEDVQRLISRLIGADVELAVRLGAGSAVRADRGQLEQVLVNLAVNAREAMPSGGLLSIETDVVTITGSIPTPPSDAEDPTRPALAPGRYVRIVVSDDGDGMSRQVMERAFEPFFTTKEIGSGLGLSTCYGIAGQLGGRLMLESQPGVGTRVTLLLPEAASAAPGLARVPTEPPALARGETILLVEDEEQVRHVTARALRDLGYRVLTANSAADAMRTARAHDGPIDLLLSDVVMPGESGAELAERFVAAYPSCAVLLVSGHAPETPRFPQLGKPYELTELARRVRDLIDGRVTPR